MGPGVELVKKEFEDLLPATTDIKFSIQSSNMDLIQMALAQFKGTKFSEFTKNGEKFDFDTQTTNQHHIIKVIGLQKDKAVMDKLAKAIKEAIKEATEIPTEACSSKCQDSLKAPFKIQAAIEELKQKYNKIIKKFDTSKQGKVLVTYWKLQLPEGQAPTDEAPDWEYVRNLVEGSMPHQIQFKLFRQGDTDSQVLEEKVVS